MLVILFAVPYCPPPVMMGQMRPMPGQIPGMLACQADPNNPPMFVRPVVPMSQSEQAQWDQGPNHRSGWGQQDRRGRPQSQERSVAPHGGSAASDVSSEGSNQCQQDGLRGSSDDLWQETSDYNR